MCQIFFLVCLCYCSNFEHVFLCSLLSYFYFPPSDGGCFLLTHFSLSSVFRHFFFIDYYYLRVFWSLSAFFLYPLLSSSFVYLCFILCILKYVFINTRQQHEGWVDLYVSFSISFFHFCSCFFFLYFAIAFHFVFWPICLLFISLLCSIF